MTIEGVDYKARGYINPTSSKYDTFSVLIPATAKEIYWTFKGHFCILDPEESELGERFDKRGFKSKWRGMALQVLVWTVWIGLILFLLWRLRRRFSSARRIL